jgi:hypothetical protein
MVGKMTFRNWCQAPLLLYILAVVKYFSRPAATVRNHLVLIVHVAAHLPWVREPL